METTPIVSGAGLFGLQNSNRDFSLGDSWGKNQFNSSFPAALCCYMHSKGMPANYLVSKDGIFQQSLIDFEDLFGIDPQSKTIHFAFEEAYSQYQPFVIGRLPRTDLVVSDLADNMVQTRALEIKLTALPDTTTHNLSEDSYGSELVVRPDTVFYLAAGLYQQNRFDIEKMFSDPHFKLADWSNSEEVSLVFTDIVGKLRKVLTIEGATQVPLLLNPIWKTEGKTPTLADCCLDVFAWSTLGFLHFLIENGAASTTNRITRPMRTLVWVYVMLHDLATKGKTNFEDVIDRLSFNTKNDKAFSASGSITHKYMKSDNLRTPRIKRQEISNIIFGGGQKLLSPERRFDAIIVNSPELFR